MSKLFFCFLFLIASSLDAQELNYKLTGNLHYDSKVISENQILQKQNSLLPSTNEKKSPLLAGLFSLILPGAGEVYAESYWKAGIFFAVEATAIAIGLSNDKKGDDKTVEFQNYANQNWNVVKYAQWLLANKAALGIPAECNITIDPNAALQPWERVNWAELNVCEAKFSHKLEQFGRQQYYEMIGKYPQFNHGWVDQLDDATPEYNANLTSMFLYYAGMRGKANDYYNVATKSVMVIYINHFLSALDGVWSAITFNKDLQISYRYENNNFSRSGELMPTMNLKYWF